MHRPYESVLTYRNYSGCERKKKNSASNHSSWAGEKQISPAGGVNQPAHHQFVQTDWGSNWSTCRLAFRRWWDRRKGLTSLSPECPASLQARKRHKNSPPGTSDMDKLSVISGCLFLAADIFAIASVANPDWISTGDSAGRFVLTLDS